MLSPWLVCIPLMVGQLHGWHWVVAYAGALWIVVAGGVMIFKAKLPVYRKGRFFTFGVGALPVSSIPLYERGWRWVILGTILAVWLLIRRG